MSNLRTQLINVIDLQAAENHRRIFELKKALGSIVSNDLENAEDIIKLLIDDLQKENRSK